MIPLKIACEGIIALAVILIGIEVISAIYPDRPTEHLAACLCWLVVALTLWIRRGLHIIRSN